jgi:caspase domain-containing protein
MVRRTVVLLLLIASPARGDRLARLVLIVGNNRPADPAQPALRYADDDAIRYYERFEGLAEARVVLTRLDEESALYRQVYPDVAPPTRAALARAVAELRRRAAELRARGLFVELVFVFAGHGGVDKGQPYLALEDGRLLQEDFEALLLRDQPADLTHVIIDACSAASFVEGRGPLRGRRRPLPDELLPFGGLAERYGRVGFVLAASADGQAYEWSRFGSGVASHLIRSALSGAADVGPPDGLVTYEELDGFLRWATADVLPAGYRQEFRVLPPRDMPSAPLLDLHPQIGLTELTVDRPGRYYLRDADGNRILDLHQGHGAARLLLPAYSPRFALVGVAQYGTGCEGPGRWRKSTCVREETAHEFEAGAPVRLSGLQAGRPAVAARGVIEDSIFELLLSRPFDAEALRRSRETEAKPSDTAASIGMGYRATIGHMPKELLVAHGVELRLEMPLGRRFFIAPVAGVGRGTAKPTGASEYPVYQYDAGLEGGLRLGSPLHVLAGIEAHYQVYDQILPAEEDRVASLVLAGLVLRAGVPLGAGFRVAVGAGGGVRAGSVEADLRARAYGALMASVSTDL